MAINESTLTELYTNYKPAYNNLYEITISGGDHPEDINNYIKFHATSVGFGDETIGLTRNDVTKQFQLNDTNAYKRADTLTIVWRENEKWAVKKYHEDWLSMFYNKEKDCYLSYSDSDAINKLYRTIIITLPKNGTFGDNTETGYNKIKFEKVLPAGAPGLNLAWSTQANIITHSLNYYVTDWGWVKDSDSTEYVNLFGNDSITTGTIL